MQKFIATKNDEGRKLIKFLQSIFKNTPESHIYRAFRKKDIKVNDKRINDRNYIINEGDCIIIHGFQSDDKAFKKYDKSLQKPLKIIYEDNNILLVNKDPFVEVHGSKKSLDNQVLAYLKFNQTSSFKPSHVGRLDKDTSGLIIYAKNYESLVELNYKTVFFDKIYKLKSDYKGEDKVVEFYTKKDESKQKMIASKIPFSNESKLVKTKIFAINNELFAKLITGKKHQIRLTMEYLKNPIYGDKKYGGKKAKRLYLHSYKLTFKKLENNLEYLNNKTFVCDIK